MTEIAPADPRPAAARRSRFLRSIWPALIVATIVLLARGTMIARHQSERYDDEYHLNRGLAFLRLDVGGRVLNDPPLGEAIGALPLFVTRSYHADPARDIGLYGNRLSPETLLLLVALWKSLLYLPLIAVAFLWTRELYGFAAAWLATLLLLVEPTFAAHTPLPTVDVIGVEGIVIACFALWKYHQRPTWPRLLLATLAVATSMLLKNTALIMPGVAFAFAGLWWLRKAWRERPARATWLPSLGRFAARAIVAAVVGLICIWTLSLFDVSTPIRKKDAPNYPMGLAKLFRREWPAGSYVRAVLNGVSHTHHGHNTFLNGKKDWGGRLDYFPVVASYKLPVGVGAVLIVGVASFAWRRPRFDEWSLALPGAIYAATLLTTNINIGFRHFLPALAFLLLLATRAIADRATTDARSDRTAVGLRVALFACVAVAFVETLRFHPNYLSFTNAARGAPSLKITDSNLDWGQSLPALRKWADARTDGRPIRFAYFGWEVPTALDHYLGGSRVEVVMRPPYGDAQPGELPTSGLFVVSPVALTGVYDNSERLKPLWDVEPVEVIDGALLVYDLDKLPKPIEWPRVRTPKKR